MVPRTQAFKNRFWKDGYEGSQFINALPIKRSRLVEKDTGLDQIIMAEDHGAD